MPNLIGKNLQDVRDAIQQLTSNEVFYAGSTSEWCELIARHARESPSRYRSFAYHR